MIRASDYVTDASAINIGQRSHIKILDSAQMIFAQTGFTPRSIDFDLSRPVGVCSRAAGLTRTRERLSWEAGTGFEEGLQRAIRVFLQDAERRRRRFEAGGSVER